MAVSSERSELFQAYDDVMNFLVGTYAMNEIVAEAYRNVVGFRQSSTTTEETYL